MAVTQHALQVAGARDLVAFAKSQLDHLPLSQRPCRPDHVLGVVRDLANRAVDVGCVFDVDVCELWEYAVSNADAWSAKGDSETYHEHVMRLATGIRIGARDLESN